MEQFGQFSQAVSCLYRDMQRIERQEMNRYGLKAIHGDCLLALLRNPGGVTSARLGELCDKDKAAVSRAVADLERQGMLSRQTGNRYRAPLLLTPAGREAAVAVEQRALLAVRRAGLSEEKQQGFYEEAARLAGNLHTICKQGSI